MKKIIFKIIKFIFIHFKLFEFNFKFNFKLQLSLKTKLEYKI